MFNKQFVFSEIVLSRRRRIPKLVEASRKYYDIWKSRLGVLIWPSLSGPAPPVYWSRGQLPGRQYSSHNWSVQLVLSLADIPRIVFHAEDKHGKSSLFFEILLRNRHRQNPVQAVLAVRGLVAMLARIPGENADLIEVVRQAVMRIGQDTKIFRDLFLHAFVVIGHLVQYEESDKALALGILRNLKRHVHIHHARQHPTHVALIVANQPPVLECGSRRSFGSGPSCQFGRRNRARLLLDRRPLQNRDFCAGRELV